jgi:Chitin binding Peritrophin-A domain
MFSLLAALMVLLTGALAQRPSCWKYIQEDPDTIDQVFFPHESNCRFYYQCSLHGLVRMKCQHGMHFDAETHQCGRPDEVEC